MDYIHALSLAKRLKRAIVKPRGSTVHIVGSICRYEAAIKHNKITNREIKKIKDIDILVIVNSKTDLDKPIYFKNIKTEPKITPRKRKLLINGVSIDIFLATKQEKHFAMLHFTSSKQFLLRTRFHAKKLGYKLNQYNLFNTKTGKPIRFKHKNDLDILSKIGVSRHPVWNRFK